MRLLGVTVAVITLAGLSGCQSAATSPKAERPINLLGDLETRGSTGAASATPAAPDDKVIINTLGMRMVPIEPGTFQMGSPMNEPGRQEDEHRHEVRLTRGYHIATTEVTQGQWQAVMQTAPWRNQRGATVGRDQPATHITFAEAQQFCLLLSRLENAAYRLPTEAEWEHACRSGAAGPFGFDGTIADHAWTQESTPHDHAAKVARKRPNPRGLFDMHGNVAEWCSDWYGPYPREAVTDPTGPAAGEYRVVRGGAYDGAARFSRSAYRSGMATDTRSGSVGLRVVLTR